MQENKAPFDFYVEVVKYNSPEDRDQDRNGTHHEFLQSDVDYTTMIDALIGSRLEVYLGYFHNGKKIKPEDVDRLLRDR